MPLASNVTVLGLAITIMNGPTDFGSIFDSGALGRRADSNIKAGGRSTNSICPGPELWCLSDRLIEGTFITCVLGLESGVQLLSEDVNLIKKPTANNDGTSGCVM